MVKEDVKWFEVLTVIFLKIEAFWEVTQFRMANSCLHLEVETDALLTLVTSATI
jgi:hypothetical protein